MTESKYDKFESCYGCPQREPGCHDTCEGYKYRRAKLDEKNKRIRKSKHEQGSYLLVGEEDR